MPPLASNDRHQQTGSGGSESASSSSGLINRRHPTDSIDSDAEKFAGCVGRIKCVLVGDGAVGKTSAVVSYTTNGYPTEYVPTAFDNYNVMVTVDNQPIRLQLCDTAGQDDFDSLRPLCYPGTDVFVLCFSVVSPTSFANVRDKWVPEIWHHCGRDQVPIVLVGTQCDLRFDVKVLVELAAYGERPVPEQEAARLARQLGAVAYLESSALTQQNLKEVFDTAILVSLQRQMQQRTQAQRQHKRCNGKGTGNFLCSLKVPPPSPTLYGLRHQFDTSGAPKKRGWRKLCCFS